MASGRVLAACESPASNPVAAASVQDCARSEPASLPASDPAHGAGNPVDLLSGHKHERRVDIVLPDVWHAPGLTVDLARALAVLRPLPMLFSRHFSSARRTDSGLGPGWRHGFETRLSFRSQPAPQISIDQADGRRLRFRRLVGRRFVSVRPHDGTVVRQDGHWVWHWPGGRRLHFDKAGRLVRIDTPGGDGLTLSWRGDRLRQVVDPGGRTFRLVYRRGRLARLEAPLGAVVRYAYDAQSRLRSVRIGADVPERYWYGNGSSAMQLLGAGRAESARSEFSYGPQGRIRRARALGESASQSLHFEYELAADGRAGSTRVRSEHGVAQYHWRAGVASGPEGAARRLVRTEGVACGRCPPTGNRYRYDAAGMLLDAGPLHYQRDDQHRVLAISTGTDQAATMRLRYADNAGAPDAPPRRAHFLPVLWQTPSVLPGRTRDTRVELDGHDRIALIDEQGFAPNGQALRRVLRLRWAGGSDHPDRLVALERLDPTRASRSPRVLATTRLHYDSRGWLQRIESPGGATRQFRRDVAGRIVFDSAPTTVRPAPRTIVAQDMMLAYRSLMRSNQPSTLVLARHGQRARIDGLGRVSRSYFDDFGRLTRRDDARTGSYQYRYDGLDRLIEIAGPGGHVQTFVYDERGRLIRRNQRQGAAHKQSGFSWQGPWLTSLDGPGQRTRASYDAAGRLLSISHALLGAEHEQRFRYDASGRLVLRRLPDGSELRYAYDRRGRPLAMYRRAVKDGPEVPIVTDASYKAGRITGFRLGGALQQQRDFDAHGRLESLRWSAPGKTGLPAWRYGFDRRARLERIDSTAGRLRLVHDRTGRLRISQFRSADGEMKNEYFAYDAAGEMSARRDADGHTQVLTAAGNAKTGGLPDQHAGLRLVYGVEHRIKAVFRGKRQLARYHYNALGERIMREVGTKRTAYLYHRRQLLAELGAAGRIRRLYLYWLGRLIGFIDYPGAGRSAGNGRIRFLLGDHLGTPHAVTDSSGRVLWRGRYAAYGRLRESVSAAALPGVGRDAADPVRLRQPIRFPGQFVDPETGLFDNYQRSYDPDSGRYLEPDPLRQAAGRDPYAYAGGRPAQAIDPLGLVLFAFDGTGNTPDSLSNVWLMSQQYADYDEFDRFKQIGADDYYVPGVGTRGGPFDNAIVGGAVAVQLRARIDEQLDRLDVYVRERYNWYLDAGATISPDSPLVFDLDIVGFSRGAAAARDFANELLRRRDRAYYRDLVSGGCVSLNIRFLGLFDTVISTHVGSFDLRIPEAVGHAASLIAANEHRRAFPLESIFASADERGLGSNRVELSLAGAHADIGGGYACVGSASCDGGDLSDIALQWMRAQAAAQGVALAPLPAAQQRIDRPILHDETSSYLFYDPDPQADRQVRYHTSSQTSPQALAQPAPARAAAPPEPSRESINAGLSADAALALLRPDSVARPGVVGEVDLQAYQRWLRDVQGLRVQVSGD